MIPSNQYILATQMRIGWSLPDQLVYTTVSALLRLASAHSEYREAATSSTLEFAGQMIGLLKSEDRTYYPEGS